MEKPKYITIINDCNSANDVGRQLTRYSHLFPNTNINFVGVDSGLGINATLEAAGNLIDAIDAADGKPGVISVNVAPRGQVKEDGDNGSKFSYFWYGKILVVSTVKGYNLSLVKKLKLAKEINVLDTPAVLDFAVANNLITLENADYIKNSQFRSFDFQPRVADWLIRGYEIPHTKIPIAEFADAPNCVWLVDSFGNLKTTLIKNDLSKNGEGKKIATNLGEFKYYERLKLIPDGETAIYIGSSGLGKNRFLEIASQNRSGSAAKTLNLKIGDLIDLK